MVRLLAWPCREPTKGIAGHEGVPATVIAVGDAMHDRWKVSDRAGIKWVASMWSLRVLHEWDG
jgi:D-arabinose 1-dehydrogenase-like Zn-dependent alcohol dehydrogenase